MTVAEIAVERALCVTRFAAGFADGADPAHGRKRVDGEIAGDASWRAGFIAGKEAAETYLLDWDENILRIHLARLRDPDRYKDIPPDWTVIDRYGKIVRHKFEEPRDEPSGTGPCWHCLRERGDRVHR